MARIRQLPDRSRDGRAGSVAGYGLSGLVLIGLLSGCSATIVDRADATTASSAPRTDTPTAGDGQQHAAESPAPRASEATDSDSTSTDGLSAKNSAERERRIAEASLTLTCPSAPLEQDAAVIRVEGRCDELTIDLDAGVVIVDDVSVLTLSGSGTTVYAATIGHLTVTGSASEVLWSGATPTVDDRGSANTLGHG